MEQNEVAQWYYAEIMRQLLDSERFKNWFGLNYDVHKIIDEENKEIEIRVIEIPPELVQERMMESMAKQASQETGLVTASAGDLKKLGKKKKKNGKR